MMTRSSLIVIFLLGMAAAQYTLVWSDEFNGNSLDLSKWQYEVNCDGGGNGEYQCYTSNAANLNVSGGYLNINARLDNIGRGYSSARINTQASAAWRYGKFEARAKLPNGKYLWPALWMMPRDSVYGVWAASGEIDIMENRGGNNYEQQSTIHYGQSWPNNRYTGSGPQNLAFDLTADFHVYSAVWTPTAIQFYVDDVLFHTENINRDMSTQGYGVSPYTGNGQPFDQPFYFIINLAMGGAFFGGEANSLNTDIARGWANPTLSVDYVRVSQLQQDMVPPVAPLNYTGPKPDIYFSFNQMTNVAKEDSGNGHAGVPMGPGVSSSIGKFGNCLTLSQTGGISSIQITNSSYVSGAFSVAAWVNIPAKTDTRMKIASSKKIWNDATGWELEFYGTNNQIAFVGGGGSVAIFANLPITYGQWFHVAVTFDGGLVSPPLAMAAVYFNGKVVNQASVNPVMPAARNVIIGSANSTEAVTGSIDEFYLLSRQLTAVQVKNLAFGALYPGVSNVPVTLTGAKLVSDTKQNFLQGGDASTMVPLGIVLIISLLMM